MNYYKVEIRKKFPNAFSYQTFPEFKYVKTGKFSYHWEKVVDEFELRSVIKMCKENNFSCTYTDVNYIRSSHYRADFFKTDDLEQKHWRCTYCHKKLEKAEVVVDHLVPINRIKKSKLLQIILKKVDIYNANDTKNLVPSCSTCNGRKSDKTGIWVLRGIVGRYKAYWVFCYTFIILIFIMAFFALVNMNI